ncbi:MAG: tRNA (N6-isopentenyl adenosine(37)-C2)-methylthiotransferase MiaB [Pseudomonadota bacterium]
MEPLKNGKDGAPARKVHIKTYGCQMNVYDSERMEALLRPIGYAPTAEPEDADLVILNTCHIREKAAEKVYSELGRLRRVKEARGGRGANRMMLGVAGCVAQAEGAEIAARAPFVDLVFGPQTFHRLPEMIARAHREDGLVLETEFEADAKFDALSEMTLEAPKESPGGGAVTAFLTIQEGCDKFCTFCVVPYTRGAETSRPARQIEAEARKLAAAGVRELTLLGQNVNAYADPEDGATGLGGLLRRLALIDGLERLRFTTSHPRDMDDDLIAAFADEPKLMPYLHLPVQSGSDRMLKAMNRGHDAASYVALVERVRRARPDLALSGDFIVGFPGETEADFEATLELVRNVEYASSFSFKYSPRPGTPAAALKQVDEEAKAERLAKLQELLGRQKDDFNAGQVGRVAPVLFERPGRQAGQLIGRSPYLQSVHVEAPAHRVGRIAPVRILSAGPNSLAGELADQGAAA